MNTLISKIAGSGVALTVGATSTALAKNSSLGGGNFSSITSETQFNRIPYKFDQIFKLKSTEKEDYGMLNENTKLKWRKRLADFHINKSKVRSLIFEKLVIKPIDDLNLTSHELSHADYIRDRITKLEENKVQPFMQEFYRECRRISSFVIGQAKHSNYYETEIKKFINPGKELEDRIARYWRDAWVGCSKSGSTTSIDIGWPDRDKIIEREPAEKAWSIKNQRV
ncbi:hypothetical protein [Candidatus Mycoplasma haematohominis]|uniref:hypothetical protein n=1 Tax=Candidatus Mycoplasma haematohominis TaxID=1494318 RepID=UPI001C0A6BDF|nr:hypothetical protein [Candidatus Mycoplasma haemohominis]